MRFLILALSMLIIMPSIGMTQVEAAREAIEFVDKALDTWQQQEIASENEATFTGSEEEQAYIDGKNLVLEILEQFEQEN